jgi:competence protein ComEC
MRNIALGVALLWSVSAGFALGIFLRSLVVVPEFFVLGFGILALLCVLLAALDKKTLRIACVAAAFLIALGAGCIRMQAASLSSDPALEPWLGEHLSLEGIVSDAPDVRATQVRVPIRIATGTTPTILAIFPAHTDIYYGERVKVTGILKRPESFDSGTGREFDYPGYLESQGITYMLERASLEHGDGFEGYAAVALAYKLRSAFLSGLGRALPEPHAGLAGGITVGDKRAMGKDLTEEFQIVSLVHIVVLSGYNITIVISALFHMLENTPRFVRFGAGGLVALFFAVMTGFASASLRAALMALIAMSGNLSGRIYRADRALVLVGAAMLAWNPYLLVFDPGFQLSFLACMGLIVFSPLFAAWYVRVPEKAGLREILVSTSSAQIAVLPLILYQSGMLSLVSLPANLLALIAVPAAMLFSAVAAVGGLVAEPIAPVIGFPAYALLSYILSVAHTLASVPFAAVTIPAFSAWLLAPIYAALFGGVYFRKNR